MADAAVRDDRLDSWKEIAAYLRRDITTVQRWEKREGMPVHRHLHDKLGSVYAFRAELDAWSCSRKAGGVANGSHPVPDPGPPPALAAAAGPPEAVANPASPATAPAREARPRRRRSRIAAGVLTGVAAATLVAVTMVARWSRGGGESWAGRIGAAATRRVDFDGTERAAALSRDGKFLAFLSDRDGRSDVWVTQVGTDRFHNLTRGRFPQLVNPAIRAVAFSPDGALVTFWSRDAQGQVGVWAVPTLGGEPRRFLDGAAELDWPEPSRFAYHTAVPGDPTFVRHAARQPRDRRVFAAPPGLHAHFPVWPPGQPFIYFVQGAVADSLGDASCSEAMDLWRLPENGGTPERLTYHHTRLSHPVALDRRTMIYLACDGDGRGPSLHLLDLDERVPRRLGSGIERYTSLAADGLGRRLVLTQASMRESLWRLSLSRAAIQAATPTPELVRVTTGRSFFPRAAPGYLLYVSSGSAGDSLWKLAGEAPAEIWSGAGARIAGAPAVAPDGRQVAFPVEAEGRRSLIVMNADGTAPRIVVKDLALRGAPAWVPGGRAITVAAEEAGVPHLFTVPLDGRAPIRLVVDHAADPVWSPDGRFVVYSGPDAGPTFELKAARPDGRPYPLPRVVLTRGARTLHFLPESRELVLMRGEIGHKDLAAVDLETGAERELTRLPRDFVVEDFDLSPDGREAVLHRVEQRSNLLLMEVPLR